MSYRCFQFCNPCFHPTSRRIAARVVFPLKLDKSSNLTIKFFVYDMNIIFRHRSAP